MCVEVYFSLDFGNGIGGSDCEGCTNQWSCTHPWGGGLTREGRVEGNKGA